MLWQIFSIPFSLRSWIHDVSLYVCGVRALECASLAPNPTHSIVYSFVLHFALSFALHSPYIIKHVQRMAYIHIHAAPTNRLSFVYVRLRIMTAGVGPRTERNREHCMLSLLTYCRTKFSCISFLFIIISASANTNTVDAPEWGRWRERCVGNTSSRLLYSEFIRWWLSSAPLFFSGLHHALSTTARFHRFIFVQWFCDDDK